MVHTFSKSHLVSQHSGSVNRAGLAQSNLLHTVEGNKVSVAHIKNILGKTVWVIPTSGKGKPLCGIAFGQGPGCM